MYRPTFRRIAVVGALALMAAAPLAACGADTLSPLPVQAAAPATTVSAPPSAATRPGSSPPRVAAPPAAGNPAHTTKPTRPPTTKPTSTCYGAVRHDLDLRSTELALVRSMCFRVGGVLRLQGIGPGLVTAEPASLVSQNYEAGVVDLRFVRTGTVTVSIPQDQQTYTITVVVIS
jgi:hypothetical protein